jgi:hypothetical protein
MEVELGLRHFMVTPAADNARTALKRQAVGRYVGSRELQLKCELNLKRNERS